MTLGSATREPDVTSRCGHLANAAPVSLDAVITLVHGTFGRGFPWPRQAARPRWFEEGSSFRSGLEHALLERGLRCSIQSFLWSGANSIFERASAATELEAELKEQADLRPTLPRIVVAHSHGGNVAIRALTACSSQHGFVNARLVTMGTPLLSLRETHTNFHGEPTYHLLGVLAFLISAEIILRYLPVAPWSGLAWLPVLLAVTVVCFVLKDTFLGDRYFFPDERIRFLNAAVTPLPHGLPWLLLRAPNDEAGLAIGSAAFAERLTGLAASIVGAPLRKGDKIVRRRWWLLLVTNVVVPLMIFIVIIDKEAEMLSASIRQTGRIAIDVGVILVGGLLVLDWLIELLARTFRVSFGRELLRASTRYELSAEATPDSSIGATVVTLEPSRARPVSSGLRHSVYDEPAAPQKIAQWIKDELHNSA